MVVATSVGHFSPRKGDFGNNTNPKKHRGHENDPTPSQCAQHQEGSHRPHERRRHLGQEERRHGLGAPHQRVAHRRQGCYALD